MEGFLRYRFGGLIFGEAFFWNFMVYLAFLIFSIHSSVSFVDFPFKWYLCVSSSSNTVSTNRISTNCHEIMLYLYWQKIKELTKTYSRILTKIDHSPLNQQRSNNVSQTHPWVLKVSTGKAKRSMQKSKSVSLPWLTMWSPMQLYGNMITD